MIFGRGRTLARSPRRTRIRLPVIVANHRATKHPKTYRGDMQRTGVAAIGVLGATLGALLVAAPPATADTDWFISPSGNIGCMMDAGFVRCDISERDWAPPPRPADCYSQTGFGQGISLDTWGPARFVCAGDTVMGTGAPLPYGQFHANGGVSCNSEPSGMRCSNSDGHGFTLSRQGYTLF